LSCGFVVGGRQSGGRLFLSSMFSFFDLLVALEGEGFDHSDVKSSLKKSPDICTEKRFEVVGCEKTLELLDRVPA
jgi:hypothetical protein